MCVLVVVIMFLSVQPLLRQSVRVRILLPHPYLTESALDQSEVSRTLFSVQFLVQMSSSRHLNTFLRKSVRCSIIGRSLPWKND